MSLRDRVRAVACAQPRGATAVVVAVTLAAIMAFLALTVDAGHLFSVRSELQNAADAGALAGARELDGEVDRLGSAVAFGQDYAARHATDTSLPAAARAVELGHWTRPDQTCALWGGVETGRAQAGGNRFCRIDARDASAARLINAVRVETARADGAPGGGAAPVFFSGILGHAPRTSVISEAVAVTGGPCQQSCPKAPLVIRAPCLAGADGLRCGQEYSLGLSSATVDTAGWTTLDSSRSVDSHSLCQMFQDGVGASCSVRADDWIGTGNGNQFSATCKDSASAEVKTLCDWFFRFVGQEMQIPIVEYQNDSGLCDGGYQGLARIVGFATFTVSSVHCKSTDAVPNTGPCAGYATEQCIALRYICGAVDDETAPLGCGWWGTSPLRPQLVR